MRSLVFSRLAGTLAATAIAFLSFSAVPAAADIDERRAARAIATILGIAVVGKIIHDKREDRKKERVKRKPKPKKPKVYSDPPRVIERTHRPVPRAYEYTQPQTQPRVYDDVQRQPRLAPRPLPRRVDRKLLPQNCFRNFTTRDGSAQVFEQSCLQNSYVLTDRLPQDCAQRVRTREGTHMGYDARCLRRNGYSLDRG